MEEELIEVNPKVIEFFVRKRTGKSLEEGLRSLRVRSDEIERIKKGKITAEGLVELSEKLKIAMIRLMDLNEAHLKPLEVQDFRRKKDIDKGEGKRDVLDILLDTNDLVFLLKREGVIERMNLPRYSTKDDPKEVGRAMRELLGLTLEIQTKRWKSYDDAIEWLREKLWNRGVLVIVRDLPEGIDGISYVNEGTGIIIARKDPYTQRTVFTLVHELGHLLIGEHVFEDNPIEVPENKKEELKKWNIERWCNKFASYFLLPKEVNEDLLRVTKVDDKEKFLRRLMSRYKVSRSVLVYRLKDLGVKGLEEGEIQKKKGGGGRDLVRATIKSYGKRTVETIVELYKKGKIDDLRALNLLNIGGKTLMKLVEVTEK